MIVKNEQIMNDIHTIITPKCHNRTEFRLFTGDVTFKLKHSILNGKAGLIATRAV